MKIDLSISVETVAMFCRLYMNRKSELPIRASEMGVLIFIQRSDKTVTPLMISCFFRISKPSVTAMVNTLLKKGYVVKLPSLEDGRSYTLSTTQKGSELVETTYHQYYKSMELLKDKMGIEDYHSLIRLLQKANGILEEERK